MNIFLANVDNPHAKSLMIKLSGEKRDGQFIELTEAENKAFHSDDFTWLNMGPENSNKALDIVELEHGKKYVFVVKQMNAVFDDVIEAGKRLDLDYSIVRVK